MDFVDKASQRMYERCETDRAQNGGREGWLVDGTAVPTVVVAAAVLNELDHIGCNADDARDVEIGVSQETVASMTVAKGR